MIVFFYLLWLVYLVKTAIPCTSSHCCSHVYSSFTLPLINCSIMYFFSGYLLYEYVRKITHQMTSDKYADCAYTRLLV